MVLTLLLPLFLGLRAHASNCLEVTIPFVGEERVIARGHAEFIKLSYEIKLCAEHDEIIFHQHYARDDADDPQSAFEGKIKTLYLPDNVDPGVVAALSSRVGIVRGTGYEMLGSKARVPGELRVADGEYLHVLRLLREQPGEPFLSLTGALPCHDTAQLTLAQSAPLDVEGMYYSIWTLKTREGYEDTSLVQFQNQLSVPLVEAYLADRDGELLIEPPQAVGHSIFSRDIWRDINHRRLVEESTISPYTKEHWFETRLKTDNPFEFSAYFRGYAESETALKIRELFTARVPRDAIDQEWNELLNDRGLKPLWGRPWAAHAHALVFARGIVGELFPRGRREDRRAFAEAAAVLIANGLITPAELRAYLKGEGRSASEIECMNMLRGRAESYNLSGREVATAMRKAALNLDILLKSLNKNRAP